MFVHELVAERARSTPDAIALRHRGEEITYRRLDEWSNAFARAAREAGAGPERMVGLIAQRSAAAVASLLGVLKAGAAYVPIDQDYPEERIRYIIDDIGDSLACVFHTGDPPGYLAGVKTIELSSASPDDDGRFQAPDLSPGNLAYVVYTSGSTGAPKGVMIEHRSLSAVVPELINRYGIGPRDRVLHMAPLGFDTSLSEIFRALCAGACLCILPPETAADPEFLLRLKFLRKERITKAVLPTALLRALRRIDLPLLDTLVVTGEAPTKELVDRWAPGRRLLNAYGSTEAPFASTVMDCAPGQDDSPPAGSPIATAEVFVVSEDGYTLVPVGEVGEIYLGGAGVARGYYCRPDLTAERFIPNRWGMKSARVFRTGDLGRMLPSGIVQVLGRKDSQVKVRGQRVALGEVEAVLRGRPGVRDAVVTTAPASEGGVTLIGHVISLAADEADLEHELRRYLREKLPPAAVPQHLVVRDELPLNEHGKIDKKRLAREAQYASY